MVAQTEGQVLALLVGLTCLTWLGLLWMHARHGRDLTAIRNALKGSDGKTLEPLLHDHFRSKERLEATTEDLQRRVSALESRATQAVDKVAVVRYNAFDEVSGEQSFALAFQNQHGEGIVLNSIAGRENVRIYCKPTRDGRAEQALSPEEEAAIRMALSRTHGPPTE